MLKAIGKFIFNSLVLVILFLTLIIAFFGGDEFEDEMPAVADRGSQQDGRGFPDSNPASGPQSERGETLPAPSPFDDQSRVKADRAVNWSSGTGFAITDSGLWLTAKHVATGCDRLGILNDDGRIAVKARAIYIADNADVAIFKTEGGPTALALDLDESDIKIGSQGFHVGYPQGKPGEVTSRLIGRELMVTEGAWRGKEDTLAWAETGRSRGLEGTLGGLSGGPAFDVRGNVVGITIAESPRRGRVITTAAASIESALAAARIAPDGRAQAGMNPNSFAADAKRLRADLKVVQVICLTDN
jgi:serine protease Do